MLNPDEGNKQRRQKYDRKYRDTHLEGIRLRGRRWYTEHAAERRDYERQYREAFIHDHCNKLLGLLNHDSAACSVAADYLEKHSGAVEVWGIESC